MMCLNLEAKSTDTCRRHGSELSVDDRVLLCLVRFPTAPFHVKRSWLIATRYEDDSTTTTLGPDDMS
jgi:hypothetical protein